MSHPQPALFAEEVPEHLHQEWRLRPGAAAADVVAAIAAARRAVTTLGAPMAVWGFGPELWRTLAPDAIPERVRSFTGVGSPSVVPVTQADIWLWCQGTTYPRLWRAGYDAAAALAPVAERVRWLRAYRGPDSRDPIGFIDGTENPAPDEAMEVALVGDDEPGGGGTTVLLQRWVHDLAAFAALPEAAQERVFGRTYADSTQLAPDELPATSHVARNTLEAPGGGELPIYRRNTSYAEADEVGTLFIGAAAEPQRVQTMLERMFGQSSDGLHDALTRFSRPVSGSTYFVPSMTDLTSVFGSLAPEDEEDSESGPAAAVAVDAGRAGSSSSLAIGNLTQGG